MMGQARTAEGRKTSHASWAPRSLHLSTSVAPLAPWAPRPLTLSTSSALWASWALLEALETWVPWAALAPWVTSEPVLTCRRSPISRTWIVGDEVTLASSPWASCHLWPRRILWTSGRGDPCWMLSWDVGPGKGHGPGPAVLVVTDLPRQFEYLNRCLLC